MIPPRPNFSNLMDCSRPGVLSGLNIYQRIEVQNEHIIDLLHATLTPEPTTCPVCFWALDNGRCAMCAVREPQEVS